MKIPIRSQPYEEDGDDRRDKVVEVCLSEYRCLRDEVQLYNRSAVLVYSGYLTGVLLALVFKFDAIRTVVESETLGLGESLAYFVVSIIHSGLSMLIAGLFMAMLRVSRYIQIGPAKFVRRLCREPYILYWESQLRETPKLLWHESGFVRFLFGWMVDIVPVIASGLFTYVLGFLVLLSWQCHMYESATIDFLYAVAWTYFLFSLLVGFFTAFLYVKTSRSVRPGPRAVQEYMRDVCGEAEEGLLEEGN